LFVALILLLVAVLGLGFASYALFARAGTPVSSTVVGQVRFLSSQNKVGELDEAVITLKGTGIPSGKSYCAWVENHDYNDYPTQPHWPFEVQNGKLDQPSYQNHDLFPPAPYGAYLFLITTATHCGTSAAVPPFPWQDHLYYADISHMDNSHLTFDILPCPQRPDHNICLS
jgi:hypothetical protein